MSTIIEHVRPADRPRPGRWRIDPGHSEVAFVGRHFGLTRVRGRFERVDGRIDIPGDLSGSQIDVRIDMASVTSGFDERDEHLRSAELFDVERFPQATFRSTRVTFDGRRGSITGDLTIRDVTHPLTLDVTYVGGVRDPWGDDRAVFSATGSLNREDWGVTWNRVLETGGLLVSRKIELVVDVELVRRRD